MLPSLEKMNTNTQETLFVFNFIFLSFLLDDLAHTSMSPFSRQNFFYCQKEDFDIQQKGLVPRIV